jgi:putative transposase
MSVSQLLGRQSLRDIESNLAAQQAKLYHLGAKPIAHSTLARVNEEQPAEFANRYFIDSCIAANNNHLGIGCVSKTRFIHSMPASLIC